MTGQEEMKCVFCGNEMPNAVSSNLVLEEVGGIAGPAQTYDIVLDHVRNYTEVPYRPYSCVQCGKEARFGTLWSFQTHKALLHGSSQQRTVQEHPSTSRQSTPFSLNLLQRLKTQPLSSPPHTFAPPSRPPPKRGRPPRSEGGGVKRMKKKRGPSVPKAPPVVEVGPGAGVEEGEIIDESVLAPAVPDSVSADNCRLCASLKMGENVPKRWYFTLQEKYKHARVHAEIGKRHNWNTDRDLGDVFPLCFGEKTAGNNKKGSVPQPPSITPSASFTSHGSDVSSFSLPPTTQQLVHSPNSKSGSKAFFSQPELRYEDALDGIMKKIRGEDHQRSHKKESGLVCGLCGHRLATISRWNMMYHVFSHLDSPPFKCLHCNHGAKHPGNLKAHIRAQHTVEGGVEDGVIDRREEMNSKILSILRQCYGHS